MFLSDIAAVYEIICSRQHTSEIVRVYHKDCDFTSFFYYNVLALYAFYILLDDFTEALPRQILPCCNPIFDLFLWHL